MGACASLAASLADHRQAVLGRPAIGARQRPDARGVMSSRTGRNGHGNLFLMAIMCAREPAIAAGLLARKLRGV